MYQDELRQLARDFDKLTTSDLQATLEVIELMSGVDYEDLYSELMQMV